MLFYDYHLHDSRSMFLKKQWQNENVSTVFSMSAANRTHIVWLKAYFSEQKGKLNWMVQCLMLMVCSRASWTVRFVRHKWECTASTHRAYAFSHVSLFIPCCLHPSYGLFRSRERERSWKQHFKWCLNELCHRRTYGTYNIAIASDINNAVCGI